MNSTVIGTTRYMSPERLYGKPYTRSSDVWSVGLVLLELVRGGGDCSPLKNIGSLVSLFFLYIALSPLYFVEMCVVCLILENRLFLHACGFDSYYT